MNEYKDNMADDFEEYAQLLAGQDLKWIAVDFDDTIAQRIWPKSGIGEPMKDAKESLDELVKRGFKIMIYTARPWSDYENIERWCKDHEMPIRRIVCGKVLALWLIDDRAKQFKNWKDAMKELDE